MYMSDEKADAVVAKQSDIQRAVQGATIMLWVPGHGAGVAVNMCLLLGWIGSVLAVYRMRPPMLETIPYYYAAGAAAIVIMGFLAFLVLRGYRLARSYIYRFSLALIAVATVTASVAGIIGDRLAVGFALFGVVMSAVARRLVAGPSYAMFSAFFRAKRAYAQATQEEIRRVRGARG